MSPSGQGYQRKNKRTEVINEYCNKAILLVVSSTTYSHSSMVLLGPPGEFELYIKRDDQTGAALIGNKVKKQGQHSYLHCIPVGT